MSAFADNFAVSAYADVLGAQHGTAAVDATEEGAVGLAGAVGGLVTGAASAVADYASMAMDVVDGTEADD